MELKPYHFRHLIVSKFVPALAFEFKAPCESQAYQSGKLVFTRFLQSIALELQQKDYKISFCPFLFNGQFSPCEISEKMAKQSKSRELTNWLKKEFPIDFDKRTGKRSKPVSVKIQQSMFLKPLSLNKREAKQLRKEEMQARLRGVNSDSSEIEIFS